MCEAKQRPQTNLRRMDAKRIESRRTDEVEIAKKKSIKEVLHKSAVDAEPHLLHNDTYGNQLPDINSRLISKGMTQ